jgi:hypothetical protein
MAIGTGLALATLVVAGCADESSEGDRRGPQSPPGQILTVPGGNGPPAAPGETGPAPETQSAKAAYIADADAICAASQPKIEDLQEAAERAARAGDFDAAAARFGQGLELSEREIEALRELSPPPGSEGLLNRLYSGIEEANRVFRNSLDELRSGNVTEFNAVGNEARLETRQARRIATSFGFQVCGRGG